MLRLVLHRAEASDKKIRLAFYGQPPRVKEYLAEPAGLALVNQRSETPKTLPGLVPQSSYIWCLAPLPLPPPQPEPPAKLYRNPLFVARQWQAMIDTGRVKNRAGLARRLGVSKARVSQVLRLLEMPHETQTAVLGLGDPMPKRHVTERALRSIRIDTCAAGSFLA